VETEGTVFGLAAFSGLVDEPAWKAGLRSLAGPRKT